MRKRIDIATICRVCAVAPRTVAKWCDHGGLPFHRLPGSLFRRIFQDDFIAFCRAHNIPCDLDGVRQVVLLAVRPGALLDDLRTLVEPDAVVHVVASGFEVGRLVQEMRPQAVALDFGLLGRTEALAMAAAIRRMSPATLTVALACEDEVDLRALLAVFGAVVAWPQAAIEVAQLLLGKRKKVTL